MRLGSWLLVTTISTLGLMSGCCTPGLMGPGCGVAGDHCYDCEGGFGPRQPLATGPIDALRNMRRSLVCGGGCGEVYYGEWISTPPHCQDPCHGDQFVGGGVPGRPFCWQPGALLGNFYGTRFDDGGCQDCGSEMVDSGVIVDQTDGGWEEASVIQGHGPAGNCPTCQARVTRGTPQSAGGANVAAARSPNQSRVAPPNRQSVTAGVQVSTGTRTPPVRTAVGTGAQRR